MSRLPDFLIIGAMKSGTTTLYQDLLSQSDIFFPPGDKEPHNLVDDRVLAADGQRRYRRLYRGAQDWQLCGDASTGYAKLPDVNGVPARARRLLGPDLKVIYLVREPLARSLSHHYHAYVRGGMAEPFDEAVMLHPSLLHYSSYAYQLRPWLDVFGMEQVRVLRFEDFIRNRGEVVADLCDWLGVPCDPQRLEQERAFNSKGELRVPRGPVWRATRGALYRRLVRPLLPDRLREGLRRRLLPKPPPSPPPPRESTLRYVVEQMEPEVEELRALLGMASPPWDLEAALEARLRSAGREAAKSPPPSSA